MKSGEKWPQMTLFSNEKRDEKRGNGGKKEGRQSKNRNNKAKRGIHGWHAIKPQ